VHGCAIAECSTHAVAAFVAAFVKRKIGEIFSILAGCKSLVSQRSCPKGRSSSQVDCDQISLFTYLDVDPLSAQSSHFAPGNPQSPCIGHARKHVATLRIDNGVITTGVDRDGGIARGDRKLGE
jgi:hypothetical protein